MAGSNDKDKNWGLFAVLFGAIFTILWGIFKTVKNVHHRGEGIKKIRDVIREGLRIGLTDDQILQSFYDDASKQFGRELTVSEKSEIDIIFDKERNNITATGMVSDSSPVSIGSRSDSDFNEQ
ncbi:MAG: hypothetical protein WBW94_11905 [Anaerolineales bacterium]